MVTADHSVLPDARDALGGQFDLASVDDYADITTALSGAAVDAIVLDVDTDGPDPHEGIEVLRELRAGNHDLVLLAVTRARGAAVRQRAMEAGAAKVFSAPVDFARMGRALSSVLKEHIIAVEARRVRTHVGSAFSYCELIGGSEPMRRVYDAISRVASTTISVILRGESGTGKELVARALVQTGDRSDKPFVSLNCAALPENLIESELFGHEKGAFTGATESRPGQIEQADGGTLFMDEIATLSYPLQTKLLRVLEDSTVKRLGGRTARKIDFRLITATNEPVEQLVKSGRFREDLYYRIHVVPIFLPPLRERREDLPLLLAHYLRLHCAEHRVPPKRFSPEACAVLEAHTWPGNVRELRNLIQRLVLMVQEEVIQARDLPDGLRAEAAASQQAMLIPPSGLDFDRELQRLEVSYLQAALHRTEGNKAAAARLLRLDPQRMKYLCRKHSL